MARDCAFPVLGGIFIRHSAVLSLTAVLLGKVPIIIQKNAPPVESGKYFPHSGMGEKWRCPEHAHARPAQPLLGAGRKESSGTGLEV